MGEAQNDIVTSMPVNTSNINYCYVCGKLQTKIARHLITTHKIHIEIHHILSLSKKSKEHRRLLEKLQNQGNFKNNNAVLQTGTGLLKVKRKTKTNNPAGKFIQCMCCKGLYIQVTLAQIVVFNRRRAGEVSKMHFKHFLQRAKTKLHEDVAIGLSKVEQKLCKYFCRVELMGKRGRKVAVLLTPSMVDALLLQTNKRSQCSVSDKNIFLFARPNSLSHYRGQDCLRIHANQCGAKQPEYLRSTQLRKNVATLSQVLNLKNNELDQIADFEFEFIGIFTDCQFPPPN